MLYISCNVTVPNGLVDIPTIIFLCDNDTEDIPMQTNETRYGNVFSKQAILDPVKTSDAGQYFCTVRFDQLDAYNNDTSTLSVQRKIHNYFILS